MSTYAEGPWTENYDEGVPLAAEKKGGHYVESLTPGDHWFQDLLKKTTVKNRK